LVTVALASIANTLVVVVTLVASTTTVSTLTNSMSDAPTELMHAFHSHPGYFGKVGMRHFHLAKNKYFCPTLNVEKLWSLVSEDTRLKAAAKKGGPVPVIDVTNAVCAHALSLPCINLFFF
jgi:hypothetical protein